jgi:hypothetical protein
VDGVGCNYVYYITRGGIVPDVKTISFLKDKLIALDDLKGCSSGDAYTIEDIGR